MIADRPAVPPITINLPASLIQRLQVDVPAKEQRAFVTCALIEALDRRANLCRTEDMELMQKMKDRAKPGPKADVEKESVGVYLPTDLAEWLRAQMKGPRDLSNVVTDLLQRARAAGWKAYASDDTVK